MRINEKLNFVIPICDDEGAECAYVHSTPVSQEVFEANYRLIAITYNGIYEGRLGQLAGPRTSALEMRAVAKEMGIEPRADALLAEIRRLTSVIAPQSTGWEPMPYSAAVERGILSGYDASVVENALVFFMCCWHVHPPRPRMDLLRGAAQIWDARILSQNVSEFIGSLPISTETENSGGMVVALSR